MTQAGSNSYTYDANGNMVTRPGQTLTWDAENRLIQVVSGTITTTMGYDGDGKRVTLADPNGVTLFVSPGFEVYIPATTATSTVTATVYPTQTYKVYFPLVMGCYYEAAGQQAQTTKYYFAGGQRVAMRAGVRRNRPTCTRTTWGARRWRSARRRTRSGTAVRWNTVRERAYRLPVHGPEERYDHGAVLLRRPILRPGYGKVHHRRHHRAEPRQAAGAE